MNEIVFIPRHKWIILTVLALPLLVLGLGIVRWGILWSSGSYLFLGILILLVLPLVFVGQPKTIKFREAEIVVMRPPLSDLFLRYEDFSGIDRETVRFGYKVISLTFLANSQELSNIFSRLLSDGKLSYPQIRLFDWWLAFKAFRISWFMTLSLAVLVVIFASDLPDFRRTDFFVVNSMLFLGLFFVCYLSIRSQEKRKRNTP